MAPNWPTGSNEWVMTMMKAEQFITEKNDCIAWTGYSLKFGCRGGKEVVEIHNSAGYVTWRKNTSRAERWCYDNRV